MRVAPRICMFAVLAMALVCSQAMAQFPIVLDFDTDPAALGIQSFGSAEWRATGGVGDSGYLKVTDPAALSAYVSSMWDGLQAGPARLQVFERFARSRFLPAGYFWITKSQGLVIAHD